MLLTVFSLCGLSRMDRRANKKARARSDIFKENRAIIRRMDILFHLADDSTGLKFLEERHDIHGLRRDGGARISIVSTGDNIGGLT